MVVTCEAGASGRAGAAASDARQKERGRDEIVHCALRPKPALCIQPRTLAGCRCKVSIAKRQAAGEANRMARLNLHPHSPLSSPCASGPCRRLLKAACPRFSTTAGEVFRRAGFQHPKRDWTGGVSRILSWASWNPRRPPPSERGSIAPTRKFRVLRFRNTQGDSRGLR